MKAKGMILVAAAMLAAGVGNGSGATNEVSGLLQKGLFEEEANLNLDAAILAYQAVVTQTDKNHQFAATAIFRLGECYRKLGKMNEANAQYQRILREFPDQTELVKLSRQQLGTAAAQSSGASSGAGITATAAQIAEIKKLSPEKRRVAVQQMFPNPVLDALMQRMTDMEQQLAGSKSVFGSNHPEVTGKEAMLKSIQEQIDAQVDGALALRVEGAAPAKAEVTSPEESKESYEAKAIKRLQQVIKDSPDLINAHDAGGETPLHQAASDNLLKVAGFLLDNHADMEQRDNSGMTPLILAAKKGNKEMVDLLLSRGADANAHVTPGMGYSALHYAAKLGFNSVAEMLLEHGAKVDIADAASKTPLMAAAAAGFKSVAETLLAHGADVNARDYTGKTALFSAVAAGNRANVELLLAKGANINATDQEGKSALFTAIESGSRAMVELLLANQADINVKDAGVMTPLMRAITGDHADIVNVLLQHGADVNIQRPRQRGSWSGWTALFLAEEKNQLEVVKALLERKADPNVNGEVTAAVDLTKDSGTTTLHEFTPLMLAALQNRKDIAQALLDHGADVHFKNAQGETALAAAVGQKQKEMVELLLKRGADKADLNHRNADGRSALLAGIMNGSDPEWSPFLIEQGADVNSRQLLNGAATGWPPLAAAVNGRRTNLVALLLEKRADANAVCEYSVGSGGSSHLAAQVYHFPPLMMAIFGEDKGIMRVLLEHKADANFTNAEGLTPLLVAVNQRSRQSVELLLDNKAEVNAADKDGGTALHWAVNYKEEEIAKLLLERGADPNARMKGGETPLHLAAKEASKPLVELLIAHGADINAKDNEGNTPLDVRIKAEAGTSQPGVYGLTGPIGYPGGPNGYGGSPIALQWQFDGGGENGAAKDEIGGLLREHGAVAEVDVATVRVMRNGKVSPQIVFRKDPAGYNHYTLYEFILKTYGTLAVTMPHQNYNTIKNGHDVFAFPDFGRLKIIHPGDKGRTNTETMDLEKALAGGDCAADRVLQWGDIVDIAELDHKVTENYSGLSEMEREALRKCVAREVTITVKGQTTTLKLVQEGSGFPGGIVPGINYVPLQQGAPARPIRRPPTQAGTTATPAAATTETPTVALATFQLRSAVYDANVVLASSDLTRVKVKRGGKEMVFDLEKATQDSDLWLENGDAIEVPEKSGE